MLALSKIVVNIVVVILLLLLIYYYTVLYKKQICLSEQEKQKNNIFDKLRGKFSKPRQKEDRNCLALDRDTESVITIILQSLL